MPVQSDLNIAIDTYIQSNFTGTLAEISALKLPLERLLGIQRSLGSSMPIAQSTPAFLFTSTVARAANVTTYTANDVYGDVFQLVSSVAPVTGQWIIITDIEVIFSVSSLPAGMAGFQLYTYGVTPPSAVPDNGAFSLPSGDRSAIIFPNGISLGSAALARGGGSVVLQANNLNLTCKLIGTSLFASLVTAGSFTPAAVSETAAIKVRAIAL